MIGTSLAVFLQAEPVPCADSQSLICRWIYEATGKGDVADLVDWLLARPLTVLLVFVVAVIVNRLLGRAIRRLVDRLVAQQDAKAAQHRMDADRNEAGMDVEPATEAARSVQRAASLGAVLRSSASIAIYTLATIISLGEFGVDLGPLAAGAGIVGVALGFGAQSLVRDFLAGIFVLIEDQYGVGDVVDLGDASGTVEAVNFRTTRLRDVNGTVWHVPNGEVRRVGNKSQRWARAVIDTGVAYSTDLERASGVIKEVLDSVWRDALDNATVLEEPEIWGVESFGDSAITIRSVLKVKPGQQWAAAREVRKRLKPAFDHAGIEFPFPQHDVWIRQPSVSDSPLEPPTAHFESRGEPSEG